MNRFLLSTLSLALALAAPALAFDRQHGSHEHGAASMMLAVDGNELQVRIESPAANLLGFEYTPRTAQEKQQLETTVVQLKSAADVLTLTSAANCLVEMVSVNHSVGADDHHEEGHHKEEHDHDSHDDHEHDEEHAEHSGHSDFVIEYHFECADIAALNQVDVQLFSQFPLLQTLDLQYIAPQGQGALQLTADNSEFRF